MGDKAKPRRGVTSGAGVGANETNQIHSHYSPQNAPRQYNRFEAAAANRGSLSASQEAAFSQLLPNWAAPYSKPTATGWGFTRLSPG